MDERGDGQIEQLMKSDMITLRREAMATDFWVTISHSDRTYARQAASEALGELDQLEALLSRYCEQSEVARIAALSAGEGCSLHPDTYDCLAAALEVELETDGAFNVAYQCQPPCGARELLVLTPRPATVRVTRSQVPIDLGGIGKGFALDRLAMQLRQWDISCFLLRASASTLLAGDPPGDQPGWHITFGSDNPRHRLHLRRAAFSGSGVEARGEHIIDPRTNRPATARRMAWVGAETATRADALSTAFMVMDESGSRRFCRNHRDVIAFALRSDATVVEPLSDTRDAIFR